MDRQKAFLLVFIVLNLAIMSCSGAFGPTSTLQAVTQSPFTTSTVTLVPPTRVPTTQSSPTLGLPTQVPPTQVPPTPVPPTQTPTRIVPTAKPGSKVQLKIGDYLIFGQYNGQPVVWRVIEDIANPAAQIGEAVAGDPLILSNSILCDKAFDAADPNFTSQERIQYGSNQWEISSLRAWLNSSAAAGKVVWPDNNPPSEANVQSNPYAGEMGFLADGNFTAAERAMIKPITQKSVIYPDDQAQSDGGTEAYDYGGQIDTIVANYANAWYQNVTDSVFLLDPIQINAVYNLFGYFYNFDNVNYWLRAPDSPYYTDSSPANVLYIRGSDGDILYSVANDGSMGVRPALVLDAKSIKVNSGDGSDSAPFIIGG